MKFLKNNILLILILVVGFILRFNYDTFLPGFNFDEIAIVSVAKNSFPFEILYKVAKLDYHAPLYYLVVHFFTYLNNEWFYLRLFNILLSLINIYVFYKIGRLIGNKKTGLFLALFLCVSHIQISITNFVKFYCICFLIASISIYYFIDILKNDKNYLKFSVANLFFILSSTLGIFFVLIEYFIIFLAKKDKNIIKSFLIAMIGFFIYLPVLFVQFKTNQDAIFSPHGSYPSLSIFGFWAFLNDYFSPLLNYSCNVESVESNALMARAVKLYISSNQIDYIHLTAFVMLSAIPVIFGIAGILNSLKEKYQRYLFYLSLILIAFLSILVKMEIIGFVPLYFYPAGLILIILSVCGLMKLSNKAGIVFVCYILFAQVIVTNVYPVDKRSENLKIYGNNEEFYTNTDNKTPIVLIDAGRFLKEYYKEKNIFAIDYEELGGSHSRKYIKLLFGDDICKKLNKFNAKELLSHSLINNTKSPEFEKYLFDNLISKLKRGDELIFGFNADGSPLVHTQTNIENYLKKPYYPNLVNSSLTFQAKTDQDSYTNTSIMSELIQSYAIKQIIEIFDKYLVQTEIKQYIKSKDNKYSLNDKSNGFKAPVLWIAENNAAGWIFITYKKR